MSHGPVGSTVPTALGATRKRVEVVERITSGARLAVKFNSQNSVPTTRYLYVPTNGTVDLDTLPDPCALGGEWGTVFEDDSGAGSAVASTTIVRVKAGESVSIEGITQVQVVVDGAAFIFHDDGTIELPSGGVIGP